MENPMKDNFIKNFVGFLIFMFIFCCVGLGLFIFFKEDLTSGQRGFISAVFSLFVARSINNEQDLENQIFELKQLIESAKKD